MRCKVSVLERGNTAYTGKEPCITTGKKCTNRKRKERVGETPQEKLRETQKTGSRVDSYSSGPKGAALL